MSEIKTKLNVGDTVWWVHITGRVYQGIVENIDCCEYQGALYCHIHSPTFKINPHPVVHYSYVFNTKAEAKEFAAYEKANPDGVFPKCMGCYFAYNGRADDATD